jgi:hypothetical protein
VLHQPTATATRSVADSSRGWGSRERLDRLLGWQPSRFLADRAEAERAFPLAERLGGVRDGRNALIGWAVLLQG